MEKFLTVRGVAAPLARPDVDTDLIMPKQFLKGVDRSGLRDGFLFDLRFFRDGSARTDFVLNRAPWSDASFLIVGPNFGCGSSREHAVWGLRQFGIRAVIGTTFGGIFQDNCLRNGVLAVSLPSNEVEILSGHASMAEHCRFAIDLPSQAILVESTGLVVPLRLDLFAKEALLRGLDGLQLTLQDVDAISEFERTHHSANPWLA